MPKTFTSKNQRTGEIGEHLAARYLINKGYTVIERNYTKKWGEIDLVVKKNQKIHFIEVKSLIGIGANVAKDKKATGEYRPEDNMSQEKIEKLRRTVGTYLAEFHVKEDWQFDLVTVYINPKTKEAKVQVFENIIL